MDAVLDRIGGKPRLLFLPKPALGIPATDWGYLDWTELQVAAHVGGRWTLLGSLGRDWLGSERSSYVFEATYRHPLPRLVTGYATVGHHFAADVLPDNFGYYEVGVAKSFWGVDVGVSYASTFGNESRRRAIREKWSVSVGKRVSLDLSRRRSR